MKNKKTLYIALIIVIIGVLVGGGIGIYLFNMPHRDVLSAEADISLTSNEIVTEYLNNSDAANQKYLADDGESKILEISGPVNNITEDYDGNKVVVLKSASAKAGVRASFTAETNEKVNDLVIGQIITVKGVIRSGAAYDEDLELYENVILEKSDVIRK